MEDYDYCLSKKKKFIYLFYQLIMAGLKCEGVKQEEEEKYVNIYIFTFIYVYKYVSK
jgi:hypothetical protein